MTITLRLQVDVGGHRYRPTRDEVAQEILRAMRYDIGNGGWSERREVEPAGMYEPEMWRGYEWDVTAAELGDGPGSTVPCEHCGRPVDQRPGSGRQRRYCADACRQAAHRARG
jgi:hypothetical protein